MDYYEGNPIHHREGYYSNLIRSIRILVYTVCKAESKDMMDNPAITLVELLRLSYPQDVYWVSSDVNQYKTVNWTTTQISELEEGDVLVQEGGDLNQDLIKQLLDLGAAGLVMITDGDTDITLQSPNFPVALIKKAQNVREIQKRLQHVILNQREYLMERSLQIHSDLLKMVAEGQGVSNLIKTLSEFSGRGVVLQNKRLKNLADFPASSLVQIWEDILEHDLGPENLPDEFSDRNQAGEATQILKQELRHDLHRIIKPVTVAGVARGYLSLIDTSSNLDDLDSIVLEQGAQVCALEMSRTKAVREAEKRLKGDLLTALLQENITPGDANLWVESMGLDLGMSHVAIRFSWDDPSPPSMRRLETLVNGEVSRTEDKVIVEELGVEIVCICQVDPNKVRPNQAIDLANAVSAKAAEEFPEIQMRCGIGGVAEDLKFWRDSFHQAGQALTMAARLNESKPLFFPDLSVYRLLLLLEHHPELRKFTNEILGNLISYEGSAELIKTLNAYFDHNGVLSQAAEALFIHRNTLIYRMERIAEISGLDLEDAETRLAVQLALRIHRMISKP